MIVTAGITNLFKTILIILGAIVLLRFLGQLMMAKRNLDTERKLNKRTREFEKERAKKLRDFGKINIVSDLKKENRRSVDAEDVDFEEIQ